MKYNAEKEDQECGEWLNSSQFCKLGVAALGTVVRESLAGRGI